MIQGILSQRPTVLQFGVNRGIVEKNKGKKNDPIMKYEG
jgi:hypothetical protein